jgi:hypothetical protein
VTSSGGWARIAGSVWRRSGARIVVLGRDHDEPLVLEGSGGEAWELLDEPRTQGELVRILASRYGADPEIVEHDLEPFLLELEHRGLVGRA